MAVALGVDGDICWLTYQKTLTGGLSPNFIPL